MCVEVQVVTPVRPWARYLPNRTGSRDRLSSAGTGTDNRRLTRLASYDQGFPPTDNSVQLLRATPSDIVVDWQACYGP
ncbi:Hypp7151 [Branchiostoma lanceolatum]|uniref:Hypp7151 protein n=1 Tax=Branchiostoma lanceolatum TaxID=7740 RepID=A0A8K0E816_BRALA|nr:Hypp7151 [Branchiostoma lanceolatum]